MEIVSLVIERRRKQSPRMMGCALQSQSFEGDLTSFSHEFSCILHYMQETRTTRWKSWHHVTHHEPSAALEHVQGEAVPNYRQASYPDK